MALSRYDVMCLSWAQVYQLSQFPHQAPKPIWTSLKPTTMFKNSYWTQLSWL